MMNKVYKEMEKVSLQFAKQRQNLKDKVGKGRTFVISLRSFLGSKHPKSFWESFLQLKTGPRFKTIFSSITFQ